MLANGFSGHGFMHAPAVGQLVAEWIVEGRPSLDLVPLRLERFAENQAAGRSERDLIMALAPPHAASRPDGQQHVRVGVRGARGKAAVIDVGLRARGRGDDGAARRASK